jgi:hypothetical protein
MARNKRRSGGRRRRSSPRTTHHHRRRRRRGGGGGGYGIKPTGDDLKLMAGAALYGYLEKASGTDADHFINKIPAPIDQLGFTGNLALVLWGTSVVMKNRWVRLAARSVANVAAYQLGHRGSLFTQSKERFKIAGWDDDDVASAIEAHVAGVDPYGSAAGF